MALTASITAALTAVQTGSNDFDGDKFAPAMRKTISLTDGTGANQADILFMDQRSVASASNDDIDLYGSLTDAFGTTVSAAEIVAIFIVNGPISGSANTTDLTIGAGSNPFVGFLGGTTPTIGPIKPGGMFMIGAGDAAGIGTVTATTADILRVANSSGATATYQIGIIARSA
jgi:hypothetical protein